MPCALSHSVHPSHTVPGMPTFEARTPNVQKLSSVTPVHGPRGAFLTGHTRHVARGPSGTCARELRLPCSAGAWPWLRTRGAEPPAPGSCRVRALGGGPPGAPAARQATAVPWALKQEGDSAQGGGREESSQQKLGVRPRGCFPLLWFQGRRLLGAKSGWLPPCPLPRL